MLTKSIMQGATNAATGSSKHLDYVFGNRSGIRAVRPIALAAFALALAYGGGLWLHLVHQFEGAHEVNEPPALIHWLRDSSLSLPLVGMVAVAALLLVRQLIAHAGKTMSRGLASAILVGSVALLTSVVVAAASPLHGLLFGAEHDEQTSLFVFKLLGISIPADIASSPVAHLLHDALLALVANLAIAGAVTALLIFTQSIKHIVAQEGRLPVRWTALAIVALVISYADGFWLVAIQGAVGAIERTESPFNRWLRDSTLLLPLIMLGVLGGLLWARGWFERSQWKPAGLGITVLLVAIVSGSVGIAAIAANSLYDLSFQTKHQELLHSFGTITQPGTVNLNLRTPETVASTENTAIGSAVVQMELATIMVHVRALGYASVLILTTNLVIVTALLAALNDRLWLARRSASEMAARATN